MDYDLEYLVQAIEYNKKRFYAYKYNLPFEEDKEFERILKARYEKNSRIKKRFIYLLSHYQYIWFCTFTFDDDLLNKSDKTQKRALKKCLNNYDFKYILNVDYGKITERKHFHCLLATNKNININDYLKNNYKCYSYAELCKLTSNDIIRLYKYINKLVNHCIKATTKKSRVYYNFKGFDEFDNLLFPTTRDKWLSYKSHLQKINTGCVGAYLIKPTQLDIKWVKK